MSGKENELKELDRH